MSRMEDAPIHSALFALNILRQTAWCAVLAFISFALLASVLVTIVPACPFEPRNIVQMVDFQDNRAVHQRIDRIMDHAYPKLTPQKRMQYKESILKWSERYNLCPVTVASIIWKESKFDEKCKYLGALGPMQTIPRYHRDRMAKAGISVGDICTIDKGVHIGCIVFKHYLDKSRGDVAMALKRYNGCVNAKNPKYVRDILGMRERSKQVKM